MMTDISSLSLEGTDADELSDFYLKCVTILNKSKGSDQAAQNKHQNSWKDSWSTY